MTVIRLVEFDGEFNWRYFLRFIKILLWCQIGVLCHCFMVSWSSWSVVAKQIGYRMVFEFKLIDTRLLRCWGEKKNRILWCVSIPCCKNVHGSLFRLFVRLIVMCKNVYLWRCCYLVIMLWFAAFWWRKMMAVNDGMRVDLFHVIWCVSARCSHCWCRSCYRLFFRGSSTDLLSSCCCCSWIIAAVENALVWECAILSWLRWLFIIRRVSGVLAAIIVAETFVDRGWSIEETLFRLFFRIGSHLLSWWLWLWCGWSSLWCRVVKQKSSVFPSNPVIHFYFLWIKQAWFVVSVNICVFVILFVWQVSCVFVCEMQLVSLLW